MNKIRTGKILGNNLRKCAFRYRVYIWKKTLVSPEKINLLILSLCLRANMFHQLLRDQSDHSYSSFCGFIKTWHSVATWRLQILQDPLSLARFLSIMKPLLCRYTKKRSLALWGVIGRLFVRIVCVLTGVCVTRLWECHTNCVSSVPVWWAL